MATQACWHTVKRTQLQEDADTRRGLTGNVPDGLDGAILLLVNEHGQLSEYLYGNTRALQTVGRIDGFTVTPLPDNAEPSLPDSIDTCAHPNVPLSMTLTDKAAIEKSKTDWTSVRKAVEATLPDDTDSYVSIHLRKQGMFERRRISNWVTDEYGHSEDDTQMGARMLCARVSVGISGGDMGECKQVARKIGAALCPTYASMGAHASRPRFALFATCALMTVLLLFQPVVHVYATPASVIMAELLAALIGLLAWGVSRLSVVYINRLYIGAAWLVFATYLLLGLLPLPWWSFTLMLPLTAVAAIRWRRWSVWDDILKPAPHYWWPVNGTRATNSSDRVNQFGQESDKKTVSTYGTHHSTLLLVPEITAAILLPTTEGQETSANLYPASRALTEGGVYLGKDQTGHDTYLTIDDLYGGICTFGSAGSGKSVLLHGIMQWAASNRDTTTAKDWGRDTRIIDFEMKDEQGVQVMQHYRQTHGLPSARIIRTLDRADRHNIDLLWMKSGMDAQQAAQQAAGAMQFSFDDGDIRGSSLDVLASALTIGIALQRHMDTLTEEQRQQLMQRLHDMDAKYRGANDAHMQHTPIGWALTALCGTEGGVGTAQALGHLCHALTLEHPDDTDLGQASKAAEQLYGRADEKTGQARDKRILTLTDAPRNKVRRFRNVEHMFHPHRGTVTWKQILNHPGDYHVVFCDINQPSGVQVDEGLRTILAKWMMYTMWQAVQSQCQNWQAQGKHTMFVCDEVSLLADAEASVLCQMKDQGRSFGWIPVVATQFPEKLPDKLMHSVFNYNSLLSFYLSDKDMAAMIAAQMHDNWTAETVRGLSRERHALAVRTYAPDLQPPCIVYAHNFDAES